MMPPRSETLNQPCAVPPAVSIPDVARAFVAAAETVHHTPEWLQERCAFWQRQLRLMDWTITVAFVLPHELAAGAFAHIEPNEYNREATLCVIDPAYNDPSRAWYQDSEHLLVHELLHIHFGFSAEVGSHEANMEEVAINAIMEALVRLERGERR